MESTRTEYKDRVVWTNAKGQLHREDGPAMEYSNGGKEWFLDGKCHRVDGPAVELSGGDKYWYLKGKQYNEQEYNEKMLNIRLMRLMEL